MRINIHSEKTLIGNLQKKFYVVRSPGTILYLALITASFKINFRINTGLKLRSNIKFVCF